MSTKNKIYIALTILGLLSIVLAVFVVSPFLGKIKNNSQELISQKQAFAKLEIKIENLKQFKVLYQNLKPSLAKIDILFVDKDVPVNFIEFLEESARHSQVSAEISLFPLKEIKEDPWDSFRFQIAATGSFPDFLKFLEKLENSYYLVEIQNLNIRRLAEDEIKLKQLEGLPAIPVSAVFLLKVYAR